MTSAFNGLWWPVLLAGLAIPTTASAAMAPLKPSAGATWNIQLISVPKVSQATDSKYHIWDFDMEDAPKSTIDAFHEEGHPVICYFSAGTWEDWRSDKAKFPEEAIGKSLEDWPGEKWVDVRDTGVRDVMKERIKRSKDKGCDGIDPDNINGWENPTGFGLTKDDAVDYVHFLAKTAEENGMTFGLKNGGEIVDRVIDVSHWCIQEQCAEYNECKPYEAFIKQNKPVFHIEYTAKNPAPAAFVKKACGVKGFSTLIKHLSLNAWTTNCP